MGACGDRYKKLNEFNWVERIWMGSEPVINTFGLVAYLFILFCFLYRKLSRGVFCGNPAQTLFLLISLSILITVILRLTFWAFLLTGREGSPNVSTALFWALHDFKTMIAYTCPVLCTLVLAGYRYLSICGQVRQYVRMMSSAKLCGYFSIYWLLVFISVIIRKILRCSVLSTEFSDNFYEIFGLVWYLTLPVFSWLLQLALITVLHYKTAKRLRQDYRHEKQCLLNTRVHLLESWLSNEDEVILTEDKIDKAVLKEEKSYLFTVQAYVTIVTPALYLRFFLVQWFVFSLGVTKEWGFASRLAWVPLALASLYVDILFLLEFIFFMHTNAEFKLCLIYPFRDLKRFWNSRILGRKLHVSLSTHTPGSQSKRKSKKIRRERQKKNEK